MLNNLAQPQKAMGMATYLISRRMFAITLMTTLALTAVARPMFAADDEAADLVPGEPRVVGALLRGVTPGPTGSILDSARISRQVASRAEQDRGATAKPDSIWNGTRNGAIIGAIGGFVSLGVVGGSAHSRNEGGGGCLPCVGYFGAIGAGIGVGIGALIGAVVDKAK